jgi:hypothetical protein
MRRGGTTSSLAWRIVFAERPSSCSAVMYFRAYSLIVRVARVPGSSPPAAPPAISAACRSASKATASARSSVLKVPAERATGIEPA